MLFSRPRPPAPALAGRDRHEFLAEVTGVAKGLVAAGVQPATGSRLHVQDPLRVDRRSTSRSGPPARSTVPIYETSSRRAGRVDPVRLRRRGAASSETAEHAAAVESVRGEPARPRPRSGRSTTAALDDLTAAGADVADERARARAARTADADEPARR